MKKSIRTLIGASIAVVIGSTLLLGGAGTLAFWSDSSSTVAQTIQSGQLDLGTIGVSDIDAKIVQRTDGKTNIGEPTKYTGGPIVPGDVIIATVNIPVTLVGQNMKAKFTINPLKAPASNTTANNTLHAALSMKVTKIGTTEFTLDSTAERAVTLTPASLTAKTVPVVVEIAFPWGAPGQYNDTMGGQVKLSAAYSLTQIAS